MGKEKRQSPSTLLWFIRHKSYVPISEIRRRFLVDSEEGPFIDADNQRRVFVGLPSGTAQSLQKLYQQGKIGLELSAEFDANVLIGVYPMNPSKEDMNGNGYAPNRREAPFERQAVALPQPSTDELGPAQPETEDEPLPEEL
jgi:hypothetical protein